LQQQGYVFCGTLQEPFALAVAIVDQKIVAESLVLVLVVQGAQVLQLRDCPFEFKQ